MPSFRISPCRRGAPHGLSADIFRINSRTPCGTSGRPGPRRLLLHLQKSRQPRGCQAITVSGLTMGTATARRGRCRGPARLSTSAGLALFVQIYCCQSLMKHYVGFVGPTRSREDSGRWSRWSRGGAGRASG
jgi:hypothetical protein